MLKEKKLKQEKVILPILLAILFLPKIIENFWIIELKFHFLTDMFSYMTKDFIPFAGLIAAIAFPVALVIFIMFVLDKKLANASKETIDKLKKIMTNLFIMFIILCAICWILDVVYIFHIFCR
ncbi:MAG: DUF948 domain-containing protein [Acetatifactor sp.]|nr:DUF948 domain-containing protein [Acetatifactor sp.]